MVNIIHGDEFDNAYGGTPDIDKIFGELGNDTLTSTQGADSLYGGGGRDDLSTTALGPTADSYGGVAYGGGGGDVIFAAAHNVAFGGTDNDTLSGQGNLYAGAGADIVRGGYVSDGGIGDDMVRNAQAFGYGGDGNDTVRGHSQFAYGGDGDDLIIGALSINGGDITSALDGNDTLIGSAAANAFRDQGGDNLIYGKAGDDYVLCGFGTETIFGGAGADSVYGGSDGNLMDLGAGNDSAQGRYASDTITGGSGHDRISGQKGADLLQGGTGEDCLHGNGQADTIIGGLGADRLGGGEGFDHFVFASVAETGVDATQDHILDWRSGHDKLDLSAMPGLHFIETAFTHMAGEVRFDAAGHQVQIDIDGDGMTDGSLHLQSATLVASDLIL